MESTTGIKGNTPAFAIIGMLIFGQAGRTILESKSFALSMPHVQGQNPSQDSALLTIWIQQSSVGPERGLVSISQWSAGIRTQTMSDPAWSQPVDIPIPYLTFPTEHQVAKGLHLQSIGMRNPDKPG
jgi:hypothetical protein